MTTQKAIEQAKKLIEQCKWPERMLSRQKLKGKALLEYYERADRNIEALQHLLQIAERAGDVEGIRRIIIDEELVPTVCEDSGQVEWTVGESRNLAQSLSKWLKEEKSEDRNIF